jgi:hypothetical protein
MFVAGVAGSGALIECRGRTLVEVGWPGLLRWRWARRATESVCSGAGSAASFKRRRDQKTMTSSLGPEFIVLATQVLQERMAQRSPSRSGQSSVHALAGASL